ncbi:hypothetical protein CY34DRAFT_799136, partial [Suillus luteus UH-Slu-Lm8-n1]
MCHESLLIIVQLAMRSSIFCMTGHHRISVKMGVIDAFAAKVTNQTAASCMLEFKPTSQFGLGVRNRPQERHHH